MEDTENSQRLVDSQQGREGTPRRGFPFLSFWDGSKADYFKYFDDEEASQFRRYASCLLMQWIFNVLCNVGNFALALSITLHPRCLNGRFSWSTVHTSINLVVLCISLMLGIVGIQRGSPSKLFQSCAGHLLLGAYELLLFARDLCIISFSTEKDQLYIYFRGGQFHRDLFTGVCATAGISCLVSLLNGKRLADAGTYAGGTTHRVPTNVQH